MAKRLRAMGNSRYRNGFAVTLHGDLVDLPLRWKQPRQIFVNSMSDLFHEEIPADFVQQVFDTMNRASWHTFQILTKRSSRLAEMAPHLHWAENIWMGVTVESSEQMHRIHDLTSVPAAVRFVSAEPLLGPLPELPPSGIDWVIAGGESGPGARPMDPNWARDIRDDCLNKGIAFFFKQWGGVNKKRAGRELDGRTWDDMPLAACAQ